jgi:hypothetical protein
MKNTKKQKRTAAEEEAEGNKSSPAEKYFNPVKERTRLPKKKTKRKRKKPR